MRADYPDAKAPEPNACANNIGIALNESVNASPIDKLTSESSEWKLLTKFVGARFDLWETAGFKQVFNEGYLRQIPPPDERKKVQWSMLNVYRARRDDHRTIFNFVASREYPKPASANDSGCNNISYLSGWVVQEQGRLTLLKRDFSPTDCDLKEGIPAQPLAIIQLGAKIFAVVAEYSYEGDSFVILEIDQRGLLRVLETYAGSC